MATMWSMPREFAAGAQRDCGECSIHTVWAGSRSARFAVIMFEQPAQASFTTDRSKRHGVRFVGRLALVTFANGDRIVEALVRPLRVIMLDQLVAQVVQMPLTEDDEKVQALLLDRLDEALHERASVRRAIRRFLNPVAA